MLELIGIILTPLAIVGIAFLYLFIAFGHEDYVQDRGCKEYLRTYPDEEYCPHDSSFWTLKAVERERKERKNGR